MSHILDALRRADEERHLGRTPDLGAIIQPVRRVAPRDSGATYRPWLLLGVALLLIAALLVWRWPSPPTTAPAPPTTAAIDEPVSPASPAPPPPDATRPRVRIADAQRLRNFDDVLPPPPPPPVAAAPQAVASPASGAAQRAAATRAPEPTSAAVHGSDGVPTLADMPASFRDGFPALQLDVHVYNRDPARRFVLIGGQRYGEGDTLREGPQLEGIEADSLRLQWRGQRLRLPVR